MKNDIIINLPLHENAKNELISITEDYAISILYEARNIAFRSKHDEVQKTHIIQATNYIKKKNETNWINELLKLLGGGFFGVFIPGFITTITAPSLSIPLITIYTVLGILGIILVFIGLNNQK